MDSISSKDLKRLGSFLEELSWVLSPNKINELQKISYLLKHAGGTRIAGESQEKSQKRLVGVLPGLLQDLELFPKNEDLVEFSKTLLSIEIGRYYKKSRHEIIGSIVCEVANSPDSVLETVVDAISHIANDDNVKSSIKKSKKISSNFSWIDAIRTIGSE